MCFFFNPTNVRFYIKKEAGKIFSCSFVKIIFNKGVSF